MNEVLRCALLAAGLSEEDVADRLGVDPKTVRRWLDGRLPYLRHRWALASLLGTDERELWPALRAAPARPAEVQAVYPHLGAVPREVWLDLIGTAQREISVLACAGFAFARDPVVAGALVERARAGHHVRICIFKVGYQTEANAHSLGGQSEPVAVTSGAPLPQGRSVEIRHYPNVVYHSIYRADEQMLVAQHAYGFRPDLAPVLALHHTDRTVLAPMYVAEFERIWTRAGARLDSTQIRALDEP